MLLFIFFLAMVPLVLLIKEKTKKDFLRSLNHLKMVGGEGFEPTTSTMSR